MYIAYDQFTVRSLPRRKLEPPTGEESEEHGFTRQGSTRWIGRSEIAFRLLRPGALVTILVERVGLFIMKITITAVGSWRGTANGTGSIAGCCAFKV